ncbi:MAG: hypothetical protein K9M45_09855 [Kiritimatiellales bacterium]|nr:hypothetical protein [Kiritimatiellales bacterium]
MQRYISFLSLLAAPPLFAQVPAPGPSLMPAWRELDQAPVLHYQWPGKWPAADLANDRQAIFQDFLAMGFNGIYKIDADPTYAADLFLAEGGFGLLRQARFTGRGDLVIGADGKPVVTAKRVHPYRKSIHSTSNAERFFNAELNFARQYGPDKLFRVGDTIVLSSWDETGLYSRRDIEYGYDAVPRYRAWLKTVIFQDETPAKDTNNDGLTYNRVTLSNHATWNEVLIPSWDERYIHPGAWKYWIDFHGYYTHLFFQQGGEHIAKGLDRPVEFFTFSHANAKWPGASSKHGLDLYWQARLNRVLTVEDCQWDYPGVNIHLAFTNQLSRRYGLPVLGWSWFSPEPQRANEPRPAARALARIMGQNTHGLLMWIYGEDWRAKPEARDAIARWHHIYRVHWDFLRNATVPAPSVAVLYPRNTGNMYRGFEYPKLDFGWACQALAEAHIPFEIIADNQLEQEPDILSDYEVLLVLSSSWQSPQVNNRVAAFIDAGGFVMATADSFLFDTATGRPTDFLYTHFGIRPRHKYKGVFMPSYNSMDEMTWARQFASKHQTPASWEGDTDRSKFRARGEQVTPAQLTDDELATLRRELPEKSAAGLPQNVWDPRMPQRITAQKNDSWTPDDYRTFHDIFTGEAKKDAKVVASYNTEPVAVETDRTLWLGFRPGHDHACLFPVYDMRQFGEPIWPFEINDATTAAERSGPRAWITRIVEKADVERPLEATLNGTPAPQLEILTRLDDAGNRMVWIVNHENTGGAVTLAGPALTTVDSVAELLSGKKLNVSKHGSVDFPVGPGQVAMLAAGTSSFVNARLDAQAEVPDTIPPIPTYNTPSNEE